MRTARRLITPRRLAATAAILLLLGGGWLWFRSSSLVAIREVSVTGVSGPHATQIEVALHRAAATMTTLDFDPSTLRASVRRFGEVHSLSASTSFPHGLSIQVDERRPIAQLVAPGEPIILASDGTVMRGKPPAQPLPLMPVAVPQRATLTGTGAVELLRLLQAAPWQLLPHIRLVSHTVAHGIVASLRSGPSIYFGDAGELEAKWLAAIAVLSASGAAGASYIDVTDPQHPAAGVQVANSTAATSSSTAPPASGAATAAAGSPTG